MNDESPKFYLDEDVDVLVAEILRSRGFDAVTTRELGNLGSEDPDQLHRATELGRVILTHNRCDFEQLATEYFAIGENHAGIIIANQQSAQQIVLRLLNLLNARAGASMANQLLYI